MSAHLLASPQQIESIDGLRWYVQQVEAIPLLSADEERTLALQLQQEGDLGAAQTLVLSQLRYVVRVAYQYQGYGLPIADLIQEGTVGLMKAVKRFNPNQGVRLVTFAVHWIKSEIHDFVIRNWRIVKVATTKAQRKLFFNLRRAKKRLGWFTADEVQAVAADLGVSPDDVLEMESRLNAHDLAFDVDDADDDAPITAPAQYLAAPFESNPEASLINEDTQSHALSTLTGALADLDPRSYDIISKRWLAEEKTPLKTLAVDHGVSVERIRQIESHAIKQLQSAFSEDEALA